MSGVKNKQCILLSIEFYLFKMTESNQSRTIDEFKDKMADIEDAIHSLDEDFKEIDALQRRVKGSASQNERDKDNLVQKREAHMQSGIIIKDDLKKEMDLLRQEELQAQRSGEDILDPDNDIYIKRMNIMKNYENFRVSWDNFHRNQFSYLDDIRSKLTTRYKVVKENATEDEIETLLDPAKEHYINSMLNDTNMKPSDAKDIKVRHAEAIALESFIARTHNLKTHLEEMLTNHPGSKEPDIERQGEENRKRSCFLIKFLDRYGITTDRKIVFASFGLLILFLLVIIIASSMPSKDPPTTTTSATTTLDPFTVPSISIDPPPPSYP